MSFIALFSSLYLPARSGAVLHRPHNQSVFTFLMGVNALVIVNNLGDKRNRHTNTQPLRISSRQKQMGEVLANCRRIPDAVLLE